MGKSEISSFLATRDSVKVVSSTNTSITSNGNNKCHDDISITPQLVENTMDTILNTINTVMERRRKKESNTGTCISLKLRRGTEQDAKSILSLVNGLASYEKALEEVHVNETIYRIDGSGEHPLYHCILLEKEMVEGDDDKDDSPVVVGMGFFYFGYSIANDSCGKFLYLEDLFIEEPYRGNGYGKAIMYALADICMQLDCERFVWQALDWNSPALKFYHSIGAKICDGLTTLRFDKDKIASFHN